MQVCADLRTDDVVNAGDELAAANETDRGAVFTRLPVVEAILDLVGYRAEEELASLRLLEPSFGGGDFLLPAVSRLLRSYLTRSGDPEQAAQQLGSCIVAVEVHHESFQETQAKVVAALIEGGLPTDQATALADKWLVRDDFLLALIAGEFDAIIGNPPYVRQERIPDALMAEYRRRYRTIYDRADLYVPFIERGLDLLAQKGRLGFICSNRWGKNKYGKKLRAKASNGFHLACHLDLEGADAFHSDVIAYPAITILERGNGESTRIARTTDVSDDNMGKIVAEFSSDAPPAPPVEDVRSVMSGEDPWLLDSAQQLRLVRHLESKYPRLEDDGCKVGIGVATGADAVFIGSFADLPVEDERKLPLVMARDFDDGRIRWQGKGVVNPFNDDGSMAPFDAFPKFAAHMETHGRRLKGRHVAKKTPDRWYRTIDRITPSLTVTPKLLIPDIKGEATVVYDEGSYYPHHNLYWVTSDTWDLRALQAVLRSSVTLMFVAAYCIRMAGGFLRFQAQYLRRIRVPRFSSLSPGQVDALRGVAEELDQDRVDAVVFPLFQLDEHAELVRELAAQARVRRRNGNRSTPGGV